MSACAWKDSVKTTCHPLLSPQATYGTNFKQKLQNVYSKLKHQITNKYRDKLFNLLAPEFYV
jgi:hypothetical protein